MLYIFSFSTVASWQEEFEFEGNLRYIDDDSKNNIDNNSNNNNKNNNIINNKRTLSQISAL